MRSKAKHPAVVAAGAVIVATGLIGLAHAPFARSLLMSMGGCPMAGARMNAAQADHTRRLGLAGDPSPITAQAPARPALGFALDETTSKDVRDWAHRQNVDCTDARPGLIKCSDVRPEGLGLPATEGKVDELALQFDPQDHLVNMTTFRTHLSPAVASTEAQAIVTALVDKLGPAARRAGDFEAATLGASPAGSISTVAYRFGDYVADVTAMNAPSGGPSIREHYMSARD
jgi:hypothetical protein